jgi:hypothetical protein
MNRAGLGSDILSRGLIISNEVYGEICVPILKNAPFFQRLELDGAIRNANYSTSAGSTPTLAAFSGSRSQMRWCVAPLTCRKTNGQRSASPLSYRNQIGYVESTQSIGAMGCGGIAGVTRRSMV